MNKLDKNFHLNFSPFYFVVAFMLFMLWASEANADNHNVTWHGHTVDEFVEEIVVVAQQEETIKVDPVTSSRIISSIIPAFTYNAGGYGGFVGYNPSGAQLVHTAVFVNDVPANEPGSGWYDFGHDIATGQTVKVITGPNGVLYGSGSIAGTVLIDDTIKHHAMGRYSSDNTYVSVAPTDNLQFTLFDTQQQSARNDNTEEDAYKNVSGKFNFDIGDFTVTGKYTDYEYDYDNCYAADFSVSNNCEQIGDRYVITIQNENFTLGRSENNAEYFTDTASTYVNESSRDYFRFINQSQLSTLLDITYGLDYNREQYNTISEENFAGFVSVNAEVLGNKYNIGIRQGNDNQNAYRFGFESGFFYASVGTSFRKPNLYERYGDGWVTANPDLTPEKGKGYEFGYGVLSFFKYIFDESIDYNYTDNVYYNAGGYTTQGAKYAQSFGPVDVQFRYNDTEQPRVAKYMGMIQYTTEFANTEFRAKYTFNRDRIPGPYDGDELEDLEKLNFYLTKRWPNYTLSLKVENVLNQEVEILPFYNNKGREYYLTFQYVW